MQQSPQMTNIPPSFAQQAITTEQIQKLLDENKRLILAILESQNVGKFSECTMYQSQLQKNLMYLAAIADAQPPTSMPPSQMPLHSSATQQGHSMQHPTPAPPSQQAGGFPPKSPFQFNAVPQIRDQQHLPQFQQQSPLQGLMGMRPGAVNAMQQAMLTGPGSSGKFMDARGSKQDGSEAGSVDGQGRLSFGP
ncbi:GRF1-interacting factor 2-like [Malania oleifera]|uniref:GRF1-interacting factor 2-like n=1 Tax=Malania oleifera TaxID=397392 RepID=UPI0025AEB270|nr:GRF1-interacting factor 2-like [Malania oleifera]XP_057951325.1 GRF1-interacting factor 2-like [Malania oleifera]XP_057951326.1 GRF1-interacting factor 2-like [Malania oleifera]